MSYENEISETRQMVELLRHKLAAAEERLRVLESLSKSGTDPFFDLLRKELSLSGPIKAQTAPDLGRSVFDLSPETIQVLRFIGEEGKSLQEVIRYMIDMSYITEHEEAKARRLMFDLKHTHGVLDNLKRGFYKLTIKGANAVALNDDM